MIIIRNTDDFFKHSPITLVGFIRIHLRFIKLQILCLFNPYDLCFCAAIAAIRFCVLHLQTSPSTATHNMSWEEFLTYPQPWQPNYQLLLEQIIPLGFRAIMELYQEAHHVIQVRYTCSYRHICKQFLTQNKQYPADKWIFRMLRPSFYNPFAINVTFSKLFKEAGAN